VFGLHMRGAGRRCHIELDQQLEIDMEASPSPHVILAERLLRGPRQNIWLSRVSNEASRQQPRLLVTASMSRRLLS
jgi:hypothetical protein